MFIFIISVSHPHERHFSEETRVESSRNKEGGEDTEELFTSKIFILRKDANLTFSLSFIALGTHRVQRLEKLEPKRRCREDFGTLVRQFGR
jgi:hypothetical protein